MKELWTPVEINKKQHWTLKKSWTYKKINAWFFVGKEFWTLVEIYKKTLDTEKKAGPIKNKYVILGFERILDPRWNIKNNAAHWKKAGPIKNKNKWCRMRQLVI